jgi:hypothetical protein
MLVLKYQKFIQYHYDVSIIYMSTINDNISNDNIYHLDFAPISIIANRV